jgi:hypothetical protein
MTECEQVETRLYTLMIQEYKVELIWNLLKGFFVPRYGAATQGKLFPTSWRTTTCKSGKKIFENLKVLRSSRNVGNRLFNDAASYLSRTAASAHFTRLFLITSWNSFGASGTQHCPFYRPSNLWPNSWIVLNVWISPTWRKKFAFISDKCS